jgi:hypothetical protein
MKNATMQFFPLSMNMPGHTMVAQANANKPVWLLLLLFPKFLFQRQSNTVCEQPKGSAACGS